MGNPIDHLYHAEFYSPLESSLNSVAQLLSLEQLCYVRGRLALGWGGRAEGGVGGSFVGDAVV